MKKTDSQKRTSGLAVLKLDVLCLDFLNSEWGDFRGRWRRDQLLEAEWLQGFLKRWHLSVETPATPEVIASLLELRALLRRIFEALPERVSAEDLQTLNALLQTAASVPQLSQQDGHFHLESVSLLCDWERVRAAIAVSFAELLAQRDPRRLKVCENPVCRAYFYDESKGRTRRYCTTSKCGNLLKLRRFRARHKIR